jgi:uncharacterized protein (DUF2236 family)
VRRTHAQRLAGRDGYFGPESVIRRLGNSPVTPLLGGGASVLLQVAHPLVAAGVAEHSGYGDDLWRRLVGTMRALYLIAFGTKAEADRVAAHVRALHAQVRGAGYSASRPDLMLWVHATLVHCSLEAYGRFVEPLSRAEAERYYDEMTVMAQLFGAPAEVLPPSLGEFERYFAAQVAGDTLEVTEEARQIAAEIMAARLPAPLRVLVPAHRLATAGLLPPRLRDAYRLRWTALHERALPHAARSVRLTTTPVLRAAAYLPFAA